MWLHLNSETTNGEPELSVAFHPDARIDIVADHEEGHTCSDCDNDTEPRWSFHIFESDPDDPTDLDARKDYSPSLSFALSDEHAAVFVAVLVNALTERDPYALVRAQDALARMEQP